MFFAAISFIARVIPDGFWANKDVWAPDLTRAVFDRAAELRLPAFVARPAQPVYDDHVPFLLAGIPALNFYCGLVMEWPWWDEWEEALSVGAYFEELAIHELQQAIEYTDEQLLIDTYTEMLGMTYSHLLKLAEQLYVHPLDYTAQLLDQSVVDAALIEAIAMKTDGFGINPGLNDAWYEPATNGQGFFLTVFPERKMVFLGWFTYDMAFPGQEAIAELGDACQRWLTAQGTYDGARADLVVYNARGGLFDQAVFNAEACQPVI